MERSACAMGRIAWGATRPRAGLGSVAINNGLWRSRAVEKSHSGLSHRAWKSRTRRGIPTSPQPRRRVINLNRTFHLLLKPDIFTCYEHARYETGAERRLFLAGCDAKLPNPHARCTRKRL